MYQNSNSTLSGSYATPAQIAPAQPGALAEINNRLDCHVQEIGNMGKMLENLADRLLGSAPKGVGTNEKEIGGGTVLCTLDRSLQQLKGVAGYVQSQIDRLERL